MVPEWHAGAQREFTLVKLGRGAASDPDGGRWRVERLGHTVGFLESYHPWTGRHYMKLLRWDVAYNPTAGPWQALWAGAGYKTRKEALADLYGACVGDQARWRQFTAQFTKAIAPLEP